MTARAERGYPTVDEVRQRLVALGKRITHGGRSAQCPAHDDTNPSLSIGQGDDGCAILMCHAGCTIEDVLMALDLMPDRRPVRFHRSRSDAPRVALQKIGCGLGPDHARELWRYALDCLEQLSGGGGLGHSIGFLSLAKRQLAEAFDLTATGEPLAALLPATLPQDDRSRASQNVRDVYARTLSRGEHTITAALYAHEDCDEARAGEIVAVQLRRAVGSEKPKLLSVGSTGKGAFANAEGLRVLRSEETASRLAVLAEGMPDSLTFAVSSDHAVIGAAGVENIKRLALALAPRLDRLVIAAHGDEAGNRAFEEAQRLVADLRGHRAEILRVLWPPAAGDGNGKTPDANDVLQAHGKAAVVGLIENARAQERVPSPPQAASLQDWPEPLAEAAFHGVAGDFVRMLEPQTEADPVGLLIQFLLAFGNLIGSGPYFKVESDLHGTNLFACLVGVSAKGRKGTSGGHVRALVAEEDEPWATERIVTGLSSGEGLIWHVRDPETQRRAIREKDSPTRYEEFEADGGVQDKRLLVVESEFASVLKVMAREGNSLSPILRQSWDGGILRTLTKNSPLRASKARVSIIGHVTRDELRRYLNATEAGNGFGNRFLWVCVRRARVLPEGGDLSSIDLVPIQERLSRATRFARQLGPQKVRRDEAARQLWHDVYERLSEGDSGLFGAVTSRAEAQVMRLALIYALLDESEAIRRVHLEAALALWHFCEASARFIFGDALGDPTADLILDALRARGATGMTLSDIHGLFGRHRAGREIGSALKNLAERGLAHKRLENTRGRPVERWFAAEGGPR